MTDSADSADFADQAYVEMIETASGRWMWRMRSRRHEMLGQANDTFETERKAAADVLDALGAERTERMPVHRHPYTAPE